MKRVLSKMLVFVALACAAGLGCHHKSHVCHKNGNCGGCPDGNCAQPKEHHSLFHKHSSSTTVTADQAANGQAAYPYYSLRGPRDYLQP